MKPKIEKLSFEFDIETPALPKTKGQATETLTDYCKDLRGVYMGTDTPRELALVIINWNILLAMSQGGMLGDLDKSKDLVDVLHTLVNHFLSGNQDKYADLGLACVPLFDFLIDSVGV